MDIRKEKQFLYENFDKIDTEDLVVETEPTPGDYSHIQRNDNISENPHENETDPTDDSPKEDPTPPQIYIYENPISVRYKNKRALADEYLGLCRSHVKQPITMNELNKMKVKDLEVLVKSMNRSLPSLPNLVEKKHLSVAQGFANLNLLMALSLERCIHNTDYSVDGLTVEMKKKEEDLKLIGELMYQDMPDAMEYVSNPYIQLAGIWGLNITSCYQLNKKKN